MDQDPDTHQTYQEGRDYTLTYQNNKDAGRATIIITGSENYGSVKYYRYFTITKATIDINALFDATIVYDGEDHTITFTNDPLLVDVDRSETPVLKLTNQTINEYYGSDDGVYVSTFYAEFSNGDRCDNYIFVGDGIDSGSITRVISKRQAYVVIGSSWKMYDGTALTDDTYDTIGIKRGHLQYLDVAINSTLLGSTTSYSTPSTDTLYL